MLNISENNFSVKLICYEIDLSTKNSFANTVIFFDLIPYFYGGDGFHINFFRFISYISDFLLHFSLFLHKLRFLQVDFNTGPISCFDARWVKWTGSFGIGSIQNKLFFF